MNGASLPGPAPTLGQLALCTNDIASTVRLYTRAFGFADAGGHVFWDSYLKQIQGLSDDSTCMLWWMVGRQDLVQLELFHHVAPPQKPLPADWRPSDLGWVRWGVAVPDFGKSLGRLAEEGLTPISPPARYDDLWRACVRDPHTGIVIEVFEEGLGTPGGLRPRAFGLVPAVVYVALSVSNIEDALSFYLGVIGLDEARTVEVHTPEMEALWGLPGARRRTGVLSAGDILLELAEYQDPPGRPQPPSRRLSDQGFMNVAFITRDAATFEAVLARAAERGIRPSLRPPDRPATEAYLTDGLGNSVELLLLPREYEAEYGFIPRPRFPAPPAWPRPSTPPASSRA
jgi:catechol 2,3-dioxygenase-like lactoylglutathione lyase family enzyme